MDPIGRYRFIAAGGLDPSDRMHATREVYGTRWLGQRFQVLTHAFGELCWINIEPSEFIPC